ncbi:MAG: YggS family pyridoxal phosphate-dependent enzyme [Pseudomonadales bacterium]|nr:YggS family pyridoxal phosphate-dependent enzyme [Pseudomonadales bacterium]
MTQIAENISATTQKIRALETKYSRSESSVRILAVSKRHSEAKIREAAAAGISEFGENFLQEAEEKIAALTDLKLSWHFIGPVQSNKTRGIAENFDWVQSVERDKIATRLSEQRPDDKPPLNICIQVNLSEEDSKSGTSLEYAQALCELVTKLPRLKLRGLMAIPAPEENFGRQRHCFNLLANEYARLQKLFPEMDTLSLGMSNDFEAAIAEGSTMVRLGTVLFGQRA